MTSLNRSREERVLQPVIQVRKVIIRNDHGENLVGILHETGSKELVIVCHGLESSKDRIPMVTLATVLAKEGVSAYRFDFAGNGESEGSFQYGNYRREADDLRAIIQHFRGDGYVISAIIGHSKGGNAVLLYASKYNDVRTVVNISGRFNLERGIEGRLGKDFLERIKRDGFIDVKNRKACALIRQDCRVLTVHGSMDRIVPMEDAFEFDRIISNHKLHIVEGADHEYTSHQDQLAEIVLDFLRLDIPPAGGADEHSLFYSRKDGSVRSRL
ncbi:uncharacterized protein LOC119993590 isoform X3 [Tripterygium wilfordii]|uniref:uncharacterized protein LOC119993590 isoform X3 n=1 Tax=Tripterygium wilfordii TaxID=458696 RepID=UPI0018F840F5|nr:uncharacterized protein LOC119993590 isoform X3 [Tripterygium wilfordii]